MAPTTIDLNKPDTLSSFKNALVKAPKDTLERAILEAAQRDPRVAKIFWDALVATGSGTGNNNSNIPKFETCRHCKQGFDTTKNTHDSWNLTADEDFWVEYYESEQGPIGSKENRKQWPQSFFWDCCGLQLNSAGCLKTEHAPLVVLYRNGRVLEALESERTKARWAREIQHRDSLGPPPSKKRKADAGSQTKSRNCGEMYDKSKNTKRVCHWHDIDAVRRFTGTREDWDSDEDQVYSENDDDDEEEENGDSEEGHTIQWTCCGYDKKHGGGCIVTTHLAPRMKDPKVRG
ncbi:hypothetical protein C8R44DRAFT_754859 [Mycena epipterygia]|nr:hypothetical protein C8R44DRAFT_754859 [Mycena epipterygia]